MELLELFVTASIPVLKVLLITALGSYLALDRVAILGEEARKHLNAVTTTCHTHTHTHTVLVCGCLVTKTRLMNTVES